ncbi:uncharacterized protein LOC122267869, partial [Penaeus japonicus]|uniref:uncharacterized protein LOC122267869 n=1 Tax=Penaeus japonicus TaxID=27405 RepID=UPI001C71496C
MCAQDAPSKMANLQIQDGENDRVTLDLIWVQRRDIAHQPHLPAKIGARDLKFSLDTGSTKSVISKAYVPSKMIQPSDTESIRYLSHTIKILGQVYLPITFGNRQSSLDTSYKFLVTDNDDRNKGILAMDFITDFEGVFDFDSKPTLTLNRTPLEPQESFIYSSPTVDVNVGDCKTHNVNFLLDADAEIVGSTGNGPEIYQIISTK